MKPVAVRLIPDARWAPTLWAIAACLTLVCSAFVSRTDHPHRHPPKATTRPRDPTSAPRSASIRVRRLRWRHLARRQNTPGRQDQGRHGGTCSGQQAHDRHPRRASPNPCVRCRHPAAPPPRNTKARAAAVSGHGGADATATEDTRPTAAAKSIGPTRATPARRPGGKLKPEFNVCVLGKRQSPTAIEDGATLKASRAAAVCLQPNQRGEQPTIRWMCRVTTSSPCAAGALLPAAAVPTSTAVRKSRSTASRFPLVARLIQEILARRGGRTAG